MPADNKTADKTAAAGESASKAALKTEPKAALKTEPKAALKTEPKAAPATELAAGVVAASTKHATLRYATLRIAIFIVSLGVLWGAVAATGHIVTGSGALYLMMGALLVSGVASFFLLSRQRDAMSAQVTRRTEKLTATFQANAALEDED